MTNKELADILLPGVSHDYKYYEEKYPERKLSNGAYVTRFAPSPTGFVQKALVASTVPTYNLKEKISTKLMRRNLSKKV